MSSEFAEVPLTVSCMNIRHKLMYVDERHATRGMINSDSDTRVYWCTKTGEGLGPDGQPVDPELCAGSRSCYCGGP